MNEEELKNGIKNICDGLLSSRKKRLLEENTDDFKEIFNSINLDDPELFFFQKEYDRKSLQELVINSKLEEQGLNSNSLFSEMFLKYNELEHYLQDFFRKELGYVCCADKAHFVLRRVLKLERGEQNVSLRTKNSKKEYYDPFYRNLSKWHQFIRTCPIINQGKAEEHSNLLITILKEIRNAKKKKDDFINKFSLWLLNSKYQEITCEINENKLLSYGFMFAKDPTNAYEWLRTKNPEILKIYKKRFHN